MRQPADLMRVMALLELINGHLTETGGVLRWTATDLRAVSHETKRLCRQTMRFLAEHCTLPLGARQSDFNRIFNWTETLIRLGGVSDSQLDSAVKSDSIPVENKPNPIAGSFSPMGGTFPTKRKEEFYRGAFTPVRTREEQERLDRAIEWLKRLVRRVPVEHRTGLRYPDKLASILEELAAADQFPEQMVSLIKPGNLDHRTERQALDIEIAKHRDVPGTLRLVCLWGFWTPRVRPPQETHAVVSMIDEWTNWAHAKDIAEQGENLLLVGSKKRPADIQHSATIRAAALLRYKYGYTAGELLVVAERAGHLKVLTQVTKRRQYEQQLRLPHLWGPDYFSTFLLAAEHEDPEAFAREMEYFRKGEHVKKERGLRS